ncbi:FAD:protein FMN transferase [Nitrospira sp. MA-1]|nr:FAD:protein FMN transferase [Nitrospira sp. MA-1]
MNQSLSCRFAIVFFSVALTLVTLDACLAESALIKRSQMLMGTVVFVTAVGEDERSAKRAVKAGLDEIRRLEELLSTWIPTSELSKVNAAAGRESIQVSQETFEVLTRSLEMAQLTQGGFNIAVGPAVKAWNASGEGHVPPQEDLVALRPQIDLSQIQLDKKKRTVWLKLAGMQVDVGGIGKGYAADLAARVMQAAGATAGVVALSGDIKTFGRMPDQQRFVFGIQHPRKEQGEVLGRIELEDEAVSTAGDYQRYFMKDGVRYHHILDPATLLPARGCQSVTVIAKDGVMADGLDTGIFVMGPKKGMALIESLPDVEGVIVDQEGTVLVSSGLKGRLSLDP